MQHAIIAAMTTNRVIGHHNTLPWHMPADMRHFRRTTQGKPIIMGRKTFESIGNKPLPHRTNIILTRQTPPSPPHGYHLATNLSQALQKAADTGAQETFIIGGSQVYAQALPTAHNLYITYLHTTLPGDTFFPPFDPHAWQQVSHEAHKADAHNPYDYTFVQYTRRNT